MSPDAPFEDKARHIRALYRRHKPGQRWSGNKLIVDQAQQAQQTRIVQAEYERLFPERDVKLERILVDVWIEARQLAGWTYDRAAQGWRRADGSPVLEDDGSEYAHL